MRVVQISSTPPFSKLQDAEVIQKVLAGEKGLFEILMRRNNQKLYRVIRGYLMDETEVVDTMQETYLTAYEKLEQFKQNSHFSTWLIRIGINKALRKISQTKKVISLNEVKSSDLNVNQSPNPESRLIQRETRKTLEVAISTLDEKYRSVYLMKEVEGMSISEIARCTDLTKSNIKVRIHRAKAMIKEMLYEFSSSNDLFEFGSTKCDLLVENVLTQLN